MTRSTPFAALGAAALVIVGSACGGGDVGEAVLERAIENESDGEIDVDLDGLFDEDGEFSIDGDFDGDGDTDSIEFDIDEDGEFSIDGDFDGDGETDSVEFDSDGDGGGTMTFDDIDGESGTVEIDVDDTSGDDSDASITIETEDGESGSIEVETADDGSETVIIDAGDGEDPIEINTGSEIPDDWPSEVPLPSGIDIDSVVDFGGETSTEIFVSGSVPDGFDWFDDYTAQLMSAGFAEQFAGRTGDGATGAYGDDSIGQTSVTVTVTSGDAAGEGDFFVTVGILSG